MAEGLPNLRYKLRTLVRDNVSRDAVEVEDMMCERSSAVFLAEGGLGRVKKWVALKKWSTMVEFP